MCILSSHTINVRSTCKYCLVRQLNCCYLKTSITDGRDGSELSMLAGMDEPYHPVMQHKPHYKLLQQKAARAKLILQSSHELKPIPVSGQGKRERAKEGLCSPGHGG
jgi:hypothetical protein